MDMSSIPLSIEQHTLLFIVAFCIIYLIIHSDVFHEQILSKIDGATQGNYSTTWGQIIQMMATLGGIVVATMVI
jgi:hypothetical protein